MNTDRYTKRWHARHGAREVFGNDVRTRMRMSRPAAERRWDKVWKEGLGDAVRDAPVIPAKHVAMLLKGERRNWVTDIYEHRAVELDGVVYLAQVDVERDYLEQLWRISQDSWWAVKARALEAGMRMLDEEAVLGLPGG